LEDRPGATISFTGHDAQPKTGTTPAPPKVTVNDDHPPQQGVLKRYKPVFKINMESPKYETVVLGAKARGYRLMNETDDTAGGEAKTLIFEKAI
jgi:hypothetical protein